jgi:hypothetical protein
MVWSWKAKCFSYPLGLPLNYQLYSDISHAQYRRNVARGTAPDPIHVDTGFILALGDYVNTRQEEISIIIAKFLYLFVKDCSLLESYEVDNFVLRNAGVLNLW